MLGFSGLATFSRWFRTEFGMSATAWRGQNADGSGDVKAAQIKPRRARSPSVLPRRLADARRRSVSAR